MRHSVFRKVVMTGLALAVFCSTAPARAAGDIDAHYAVSLMGMRIGVAQMKAQLRQERYKIDMWVKLTGLAGVVTGGKGAASASGTVAGDSVKPGAFAVTTASGDKSISVRMALSNGNVRAVAIDPPPPDRPGRIPLRDSDKLGIIDPVSALLMPVASSVQPGDPAACNRTIPVFDGASRFDIPLNFARMETISGMAYQGVIAVCTGRYTPISGHQPDRADMKFMAGNRDIEVWLAPAGSNRLFIPYRIAVRSPIGLVTIEATRFPGGANTENAQNTQITKGSRPVRASN